MGEAKRPQANPSGRKVGCYGTLAFCKNPVLVYPYDALGLVLAALCLLEVGTCKAGLCLIPVAPLGFSPA